MPSLKLFKARDYSPESSSAIKFTPYLTLTTIDRELPINVEQRLLPGLFVLKKGSPVKSKTAGTGVIYLIEGELQIDDITDPGNSESVLLTKGDIVVIDKDIMLKVSTPSNARGFGVGHHKGAGVITDNILSSIDSKVFHRSRL